MRLQNKLRLSFLVLIILSALISWLFFSDYSAMDFVYHIFTLVTFALVLLWVNRYLVLRRIDSLQQRISRFGDGDLSAREDVVGQDELSQVAQSFNEMAEKLQRSQLQNQQLAIAVEQSPVSVIITDKNGHILHVNSKFVEVTGYTLDEVRGQTPRVFKSGHTSDAEYEKLWETVTSGQTWYGEFYNRKKNGDYFWEHASISPAFNDRGEIEHIIAVKEDVSVRKQYEERFRQQANYDSLTGLPNRALLHDRIQHSLQQGVRLALAAVDLDDFQKINITMGHQCGDQLLQATAGRLQQVLKTGETLARLDADEFFLIFVNRDETSIQVALQKIRQLLTEPFVLNGQEVFVTACIGVTFAPEDSNDINILRRNVFAALRRAKDAGGNQTCFFKPEINERAVSLFSKENELRQALARNELELYYQPQMDSQGKISGAEALLRWNSSKLGFVVPDKFIPLAEQTGLIVDIGSWVLQKACLQATTWPEHILVSVNVSSRQLSAGNLIEEVKRILEISGLKPQRLQLEITESLMQENLANTAKILTELSKLGVLIALDDFGTGFSSLNYLNSLPFNTLKLDHSFISNIAESERASSLCKAIIRMAQTLDLTVIAEGVEEQQQLDLLHSWGVSMVQGYFYSKPLPVAGFDQLLTKEQAS